MQKNVSKVIETVMISNPEAALEQEGLTYQSAELQDIIHNFDIAAQFKEVHRTVIDLLQATATFRYASVPNGIFFELRNKKKTEKELEDLFIKMEKALTTAQTKMNHNSFASNEKQILKNAITYACKSIMERIKSLQSRDRLLPLWEQSSLKKKIMQA